MPMTYRTVTIQMEDLNKTYAPDEVLGYCQHCHNYGKNYSCPGFMESSQTYLAPYKYATLVLTETSSAPIKDLWDQVKEKTFDSWVLDLHKGYDGRSMTPETAVSMVVFEEVKNSMADLLLDLEAEGVISSAPGSCTRCEACTKEAGQPCVHPEKVRPSLEALGYLVSDIYKEFFDLKLEWSDKVLQDHFHTCSAIFSKVALDAKVVEQRLLATSYRPELTWNS